jgi:hypothetical protein
MIKESLGNITRAADTVFPENVCQGRFVLLEQAHHILSLSDLGVRATKNVLASQTNKPLNAQNSYSDNYADRVMLVKWLNFSSF